MRELVVLFVVGCGHPAPPPPPPPPPPPASAPALAPASASASTPASASAPPSAPPPPDAGISPSENALVAALKKDHASLLTCHRTAKRPTGDMTISVVIGVNGKVEATSLGPIVTVPMSLARCVEERVRLLRVEISPTTVQIPFHFGMNAYDGPIIHYGNGPFDPGY